MAETLGSLCDKLTIVNLKTYHSTDAERLKSLDRQRQQLAEEIDEYVGAALSGQIKADRLIFQSNKVYDKSKWQEIAPEGGLGNLVYLLANANCELWHEQEKVYNFHDVPLEDKNALLGNLAKLNLKRNACIDSIDAAFAGMVTARRAE